MRKSLLLLFLFPMAGLISSFILVKGPGSTLPDDMLTPAERQLAVNYFIQTRERFLGDIKGLSEAQLHFKADSAHWSVAQCTEHIAIAETLIWQWIQGQQHQPANPEKRVDAKMTTEQVIAVVTDRTHKMTAPEFLQPAGKFPDTRAAVLSFVNRRDSIIGYIKVTQDDLKDHFITHPAFGTMDDYQGLVMLAAHCARHTLQIEEVKANPNFPKQ